MTNDRRSSFPTYCQKNEFLKHLSLREKKGLKLNILTRFVGKGGEALGGFTQKQNIVGKRRKRQNVGRRRVGQSTTVSCDQPVGSVSVGLSWTESKANS